MALTDEELARLEADFNTILEQKKKFDQLAQTHSKKQPVKPISTIAGAPVDLQAPLPNVDLGSKVLAAIQGATAGLIPSLVGGMASQPRRGVGGEPIYDDKWQQEHMKNYVQARDMVGEPLERAAAKEPLAAGAGTIAGLFAPGGQLLQGGKALLTGGRAALTAGELLPYAARTAKALMPAAAKGGAVGSALGVAGAPITPGRLMTTEEAVMPAAAGGLLGSVFGTFMGARNLRPTLYPEIMPEQPVGPKPSTPETVIDVTTPEVTGRAIKGLLPEPKPDPYVDVPLESRTYRRRGPQLVETEVDPNAIERGQLGLPGMRGSLTRRPRAVEETVPETRDVDELTANITQYTRGRVIPTQSPAPEINDINILNQPLPPTPKQALDMGLITDETGAQSVFNTFWREKLARMLSSNDAVDGPVYNRSEMHIPYNVAKTIINAMDDKVINNIVRSVPGSTLQSARLWATNFLDTNFLKFAGDPRKPQDLSYTNPIQTMRTLNDMDYARIGRELGISKPAVRQIRDSINTYLDNLQEQEVGPVEEAAPQEAEVISIFGKPRSLSSAAAEGFPEEDTGQLMMWSNQEMRSTAPKPQQLIDYEKRFAEAGIPLDYKPSVSDLQGQIKFLQNAIETKQKIIAGESTGAGTIQRLKAKGRDRLTAEIEQHKADLEAVKEELSQLTAPKPQQLTLRPINEREKIAMDIARQKQYDMYADIADPTLGTGKTGVVQRVTAPTGEERALKMSENRLQAFQLNDEAALRQHIESIRDSLPENVSRHVLKTHENIAVGEGPFPERRAFISDLMQPNKDNLRSFGKVLDDPNLFSNPTSEFRKQISKLPVKERSFARALLHLGTKEGFKFSTDNFNIGNIMINPKTGHYILTDLGDISVTPPQRRLSGMNLPPREILPVRAKPPKKTGPIIPATSEILGSEEPTVFMNRPEFNFKPPTSVDAYENTQIEKRIADINEKLKQARLNYIANKNNPTQKEFFSKKIDDLVSKLIIAENDNFNQKIPVIEKQFGNIEVKKPYINQETGTRTLSFFDKDSPNFKLNAHLKPDGEVTLTIRTTNISPATGKQVGSKSSNIRADKAFAAIEYYFGRNNIQKYTGQWFLDDPTTLPQEALSGNAMTFRDAFKRFKEQGLDTDSALNSAVRQTWTAKQAIRRGYTQSRIIQLNWKDDGETLDNVKVEFSKPTKQLQAGGIKLPPQEVRSKPPETPEGYESSAGGIRKFTKYDNLLRKRSEVIQDEETALKELNDFTGQFEGEAPDNAEYRRLSRNLRNAELGTIMHRANNPTHEDLMNDYDQYEEVIDTTSPDSVAYKNAIKKMERVKERTRKQIKKYPEMVAFINEEHPLRAFAEQVAREDPAIVRALESIGFFLDEFMNAPQFGETDYQPKLPGPIDMAINKITGRSGKKPKQLPAPKKDKE